MIGGVFFYIKWLTHIFEVDLTLPEFLIMRHGETEWNVQGRWQGHLDSPLTPKGREQAQRQRDILRDFGITEFDGWTSPQGRAFHTAAIALTGLVGHIHTHEGLREITIGDWTGKTKEFIKQQTGDVAEFEPYSLAPGGEGFESLRERCTAFLNDLRGPSIIVTHGITSRMMRLIAMDLPNSDMASLPGGQGVVHHIRDGKQSILK